MSKELYILYNDLDKFAVMQILDHKPYTLVYFSKNQKHLSNTELFNEFHSPVTDKALKAKLAKRRFLSKFFQLPADLYPIHVGNVNFKPLKSKADTEFATSLFHELHNSPIEPYYSDNTMCYIKGLNENSLALLVDFFHQKQKENTQQIQEQRQN